MTGAILVMERKLEAVDPMVQRLSQSVAHNLRDDAQFRFAICISEALTNLVLHAQNCESDAQIDIEIEQTDHGVAVDIFDPKGAKPFDLKENARKLSDIDATAEGGRGLGLILECADHVTYGPVKMRNRLRLEFNVR